MSMGPFYERFNDKYVLHAGTLDSCSYNVTRDRKGTIKAKIFDGEVKIGTLLIENQSETRGWEEITKIRDIAIPKIQEVIEKYQVQNLPRKQLKLEKSEEVSSEEKLKIFFRKGVQFNSEEMSIPCSDKPIEGGKLIQIVHKGVLDQYDFWLIGSSELLGSPGEGACVGIPSVEDRHLHIQDEKDWIMSLGGWKGMSPSLEVRDYYFQDEGKKGVKFKSVRIFDCETIFSIKKYRIHLPEGFSIGGVDLTRLWKVTPEGKLSFVNSSKTDFTYRQIARAITYLKIHFKIEDSQTAQLQLQLLNRQAPSEYFWETRIENCQRSNREKIPKWFLENIPEQNQSELLTFLHFINALMFGVEASGLNAAIGTGLMTLDLIQEKKLTYQEAFDANEDGGAYPYACKGDNRGTYKNREKLLEPKSYNMDFFIKNLSESPVAVKEALMIRKWLIMRCDKISVKNSYEEQKAVIKSAVEKLITLYF